MKAPVEGVGKERAEDREKASFGALTPEP